MPFGVGISKTSGLIGNRLRRTLQRLAQEATLSPRGRIKDQRDLNRRIRQLNAEFAAGTIREDDNPKTTTRNRRAVEALRAGT